MLDGMQRLAEQLESSRALLSAGHQRMLALPDSEPLKAEMQDRILTLQRHAQWINDAEATVGLLKYEARGVMTHFNIRKAALDPQAEDTKTDSDDSLFVERPQNSKRQQKTAPDEQAEHTKTDSDDSLFVKGPEKAKQQQIATASSSIAGGQATGHKR